MGNVLVRWILFILIGLPFQFIMKAIYPLIHLWWRLTQFKPVKDKLILEQGLPSTHVLINATERRDGGWFHNNMDNHNMLTHFGINEPMALELMVRPDGHFLRRYSVKGGMDGADVSGDCVVSWCFAYTLISPSLRPVSALRRAATAYLKNLGTLSLSGVSAQRSPFGSGVSARCNNFGINYCPDSDFLRLGQPAGGPQFYTSSCLFALAAKELGGIWKAVFWVHWILLGGWYWCFSPVIYTEKNKLGYVRDITMKALFVHATCFGDRWWIRKPMEFITDKISEAHNPLFYAMLGRDEGDHISDLPVVLDPWIFQRVDCRLEVPSDHANLYTLFGVYKTLELGEAIFCKPGK